MKARYFLTAAPLAFALAQPANAQVASGTQSVDASSSPSPSSTPQATAATPESESVQGNLQDIVVTAQRRSERLQDVPISITAITGDALTARGIADTTSLQAVSPGLDVSQQGNGITPFLRGVGTTSGAIGSEPSVATYVDGVYLSVPAAGIFSLAGIERIEVLRGPQGTLFGRNATGGVINVVTRDPTHETRLDAQVGYGNYDTLSGSAYFSTGLGDDLAFNLSAYGNDQRDGWGRNEVTGRDIFRSKDYGGRTKLLWEPGVGTSFVLSGDYLWGRSEGGLTTTTYPGAIALDGTGYSGRYVSRQGQDNFSVTEQYGASLKVTQDVGFASIVSITGYRKFNGDVFFDQDGTPIPIISARIDQRAHTFSQELQLVSAQDSRFTWILGGYYFKDYQAYKPLALANIYSIDSDQRTRSLAGFAQATWEFLPDTRLTGGLRYTDDRREVEGRLLTPGGAVIPGSPAAQQASFDKWTYRASLDHRFTRDINAYVSYNRGFKSGTYNLLTYSNPVVRPEVLDAFEGGLKSDLLGRTLRLNLSGFYYRYSDIQVDQIVQGATITLNAGKARIYGGEAEFVISPTRNFSVSGGLALLHGRYTQFQNGPVNVPNPASCDVNPQVPGSQPGNIGPRVGGNLTCSADLSGNRTVRTPDVTYNVAVSWKIPTSSGDFDVNASLYSNSGFAWLPDNRLEQPAYALANASLRWTEPSDRFWVEAWGKNLADARYDVAVASTSLGDTRSPAAPRTYGLTIGTRIR